MSLLEKYTFNVSEPLENIIPASYTLKHQDTMKPIFQILSRKVCRNPVLLSDDRTLKLAVVLEFTKALLIHNFPNDLQNAEHFQNREILQLNHASLLSIENDEAYHSVLDTLTDELLEVNNQVFFYIDDAHLLIGSCVSPERWNSKFWRLCRNWEIQVIWGSNDRDYASCIRHHNAEKTVMRATIRL
jgi:ATP-dependent Clp protease ATP-binding subunit ClpA